MKFQFGPQVFRFNLVIIFVKMTQFGPHC